MPVTTGTDMDPSMLVVELIDKDNGRWKAREVRETFLPCDAEIICSLPLCPTWPNDKLIWHFSANGEFSVKSAYQVARARVQAQTATSSDATGKSFWRLIWKLDVPPRIKVFAWKVGAQALATKMNLAIRVPAVDMRCDICGAVEELDVHVLFLCPLAREVWSHSGFEDALWQGGGLTALDIMGRLRTSCLWTGLLILWL